MHARMHALYDSRTRVQLLFKWNHKHDLPSKLKHNNINRMHFKTGFKMCFLCVCLIIIGELR